MIEAASWQQAKGWRWASFSPAEMACKGDGSLKIDEAFMDRLQALRDKLGFPLVVSSAYRTPAYNAKVSDSGPDGPHTTGHAVDLIANGPRAYAIVGAAAGLGFTGIGLSQKGDVRARFVHLDDLPMSTTLPRPWIWTYNEPGLKGVIA